MWIQNIAIYSVDVFLYIYQCFFIRDFLLNHIQGDVGMWYYNPLSGNYFWIQKKKKKIEWMMHYNTAS